jgi:hypothetical protein
VLGVARSADVPAEVLAEVLAVEPWTADGTAGPLGEHAVITEVTTTVSSGRSGIAEADRAARGAGRRAAFVAGSACLGEHAAPRMPGMVGQVGARVCMVSHREQVLSAWQARPAAGSSPKEDCPVASADRSDVRSTAIAHTTTGQECGTAMTAGLGRQQQRNDPLPNCAPESA